MPHIAKVTPISVPTREDETTITPSSPSTATTPKPLELGPVTKRSCTDAAWCFYFAFLWVAFIAGGIYTLITGNYKYIGRVYDSDGQLCGIDPGYEDYSYLYYPIPGIKYTIQTVCIKTCPVSPLATNLIGLYKKNSLFTNTAATSNSVTVIDADLASGASLDGNFYMYNTLTFANRLCMPQKSGTTFTPLSDALVGIDIFGQWVSDLKETFYIVGISLGAALFIGLLYVFLMRYQPATIFILGLVLTMAALICNGVLLTVIEDTDQSDIADTTNKIEGESIISKNILAKEVIACASWVVVALVYMSLIIVFKPIVMANRVMKTATDYVRKTWKIFPFSICLVICLVIFCAAWILATYVLVGWGEITNIKALQFGVKLFDSKARFVFIFYVFMFFFASRFLYGFSQLIIASSTCHWYFSQGVHQKTSSDILPSMGRTIKYHLGSLVTGSLTLTLLAPIKLIFYLIGPDPYKTVDQSQSVLGWLACRCKCLAPLKRFLATMNDSAYIQIALTGKSFSDAAKDSFALTARNYHKMKSIKGIGNLHAFYGQMLIGSIACLPTTAYLLLSDTVSSKIFSPVVPIIVSFVFAFMTGGLLVTIYGTVIDTLVMCFIIEEERYITENIPFKHCPKSLKLLAFKAQRKVKAEENFDNLELKEI